MIQVPTWRLGRAMATRKKMIQVPTGRLEPTLNPVKLLVHQRGSLIATTRLLAQAALIAEQEDRRHYFTIATIICAQAAAECILNEWAHDVDPATYSQFVQEQWGFVRIAEELLPKIAGTLPPTPLERVTRVGASASVRVTLRQPFRNQPAPTAPTEVTKPAGAPQRNQRFRLPGVGVGRLARGRANSYSLGRRFDPYTAHQFHT